MAASAAARSGAMTTPLPAARPSALTTNGAVLAEGGLGRGRLVEDAVAGRGQAVTVGERLGEGLGRLQLAGGRARPEAGEPGFRQGVGEPGRNGVLGTDHHQVGRDLLGEGDEARNVGRAHRADLAEDRHTGVARRADQRGEQGGLGDLPRQRVLAPAGTHKQNLHARPLARSRQGVKASVAVSAIQRSAALRAAGLATEAAAEGGVVISRTTPLGSEK